MLQIRKSSDRGHTELNWLSSQHTFSFGGYQDPRYQGISVLRVINEDIVQPKSGFPKHSHQNMEILSYVLKGQLSHQDTLGNQSTIEAGEVQLMSAGSGISHSEWNGSPVEEVHFLQIWVLPQKLHTKPNYQQKHFSTEDKLNKLCLLASPRPQDQALLILQDVEIFSCILQKKSIHYTFQSNRCGYLQVAFGNLHCNDLTLQAGDGLYIDQDSILLQTEENKAEILLFNLPKL